MIGFDDAQSVGETTYGLIGEANRRRRSVWQTASAGALAVVVLFMLVMANSQDGASSVGVQSSASSAPQLTSSGSFAPTTLFVASAEAADTPCATKPFGQCAGVDFNTSKADRDSAFAKQFNISVGAAPPPKTALPFACCPVGTSCISFGPVFGMCMPTFGAKMMMAMIEEHEQLELAAKKKPVEKKDDKNKDDKKDEKDKAKDDDTPAEAPCATKMWGQCAGINFNTSKADRSAAFDHMFNASAPAPLPKTAVPFACCPTGSSCVTMGPMWGMCMPSWMPGAVPK